MIRNIDMKKINEMEEQAREIVYLNKFSSCSVLLTIKWFKNKKLVSASLPAPIETIEQIKKLNESDLMVYSGRFDGKRIKINLSQIEIWNNFLKTYAAFNMRGHIKIKEIIKSKSISLKKLREATMQILKQGNDTLFRAKKPIFQ